MSALHPTFSSLTGAGITEGQEVGRVDRSLLEHPTEQRLADLSGVVGSQIEEMIREKKYPLALESFAGLAGELETFFNDVLVMAEDPTVRRNRMALLQHLRSRHPNIRSAQMRRERMLPRAGMLAMNAMVCGSE